MNYGWTYPMIMKAMETDHGFKAKNRKIHIVAEQVGYKPDHSQGGTGVDPEVRL